MKQGNLTLFFEEEKLAALRRYMGKKDLNLETELVDVLIKLYEKYVPAPVREYIDETDTPAPVALRPRRSPPKSAVSKLAEEQEVTQ